MRVQAQNDALRAHGFDDRAIHDAVQVISYFNYITRVADALGVEPVGTDPNKRELTLPILKRPYNKTLSSDS